ncbi:MAG: hypothetical protein JNM21_14895 [Taibaiella sp.]|nr:hypothetical protein [Taibaiella sp.]
MNRNKQIITMEEMVKKVEMMERVNNESRQVKKLNDEKIDELLEVVNLILEKHGIFESLCKVDICFSAGYVGNIELESDKLSTILFENFYPQQNKITLSHFTSLEVGKSILDNGEFWLHNLNKNSQDDEFRKFYSDHLISDYEEGFNIFNLRIDSQSLMSELYSLSLTDPSNDALWCYFGNNGTGLKLTFEIETQHVDFRKVYYSENENADFIQLPLINDLTSCIKKKFGLDFRFKGFSKFGGFYIHNIYGDENEFRFLIKRGAEEYDTSCFQVNNTNNEGVNYIKLPFDSDFGKFKLVEVTIGSDCDEQMFTNEIVPILLKKYKDIVPLKSNYKCEDPNKFDSYDMM